jgi:diacylglycerol kinase (ATP)
MRQAVIIASLSSRHGKVDLNLARTLLNDRGIEVVESFASSDHRKLCRRVKSAVKAGHRLIVACGGDGMQTSIVGELAHTHAVLGVIPAGTGNSFARSLGIKLSVDDAVDVIVKGKVAKVDLGVVNGTHFANFATIGLPSEIARRTPRSLKKWVGPLAYAIAGVGPIFTRRPFACVIKWKRRKLKLHTHQVIVANGRFYGDKPLLPKASLTDGKLAFFTTTGLSVGDKIGTYIDFLRGDQTKRRDAQYFSASKIRVKTRKRQPISIDGDYLGKTPAKFSVDRRALKVMVPKRFKEDA